MGFARRTARRQLPHLHVLEHALTKRCHETLLCEGPRGIPGACRAAYGETADELKRRDEPAGRLRVGRSNQRLPRSGIVQPRLSDPRRARTGRAGGGPRGLESGLTPAPAPRRGTPSRAPPGSGSSQLPRPDRSTAGPSAPPPRTPRQPLVAGADEVVNLERREPPASVVQPDERLIRAEISRPAASRRLRRRSRTTTASPTGSPARPGGPRPRRCRG